MHGRKPVSTGIIAATLAAVALLGGCRDKATTGPANLQSKDFAAAIQAVSGNAQLGAVGAALTQQITVKVIDANGLPVQGASVTFTVRSGGGSVNPPASTSSATGTVAATWTLGTTLGANSVVALLTNGVVVDSAVFTATASPAPPAVITVVSGDQQTGIVGRALAAPLVIKVTDPYGYPVPGAKITWTPGSTSGAVKPVSDTTGADGTVSANWTLGALAITQTAAASFTGVTPVFFSAIALPDSVHAFALITGPAAGGGVSTALPTPISVRVTDKFGNLIKGDTVTFNDSLAGGGSVAPAKAITDASGTASTIWTLGGHVGPQLMRMKLGSGATLTVNSVATVMYSSVLAGNFMACGIAATNNQAYCWGAGDAGQLGKGTLINATNAPSTPVSTTSDSVIGPFLQVRQMSGGRDSFCALTIARQLYCWGRVIGQSAAISPSAQFEAIVTGSSSQQILPNLIAVGETHICLADFAGLTFCTGVNFHGQLGDGSPAPFITPSVGTYLFVLPPPVAWSNIAAGQSHNCGLPRFNAADPNSQTPLCWGSNSNGQLGIGGTVYGDFNAPQMITLPAGVTGFDSTSITAGTDHSCGIAAAPALMVGQAFCWGGNGFGQLGSGVAGQGIRDSVPTAVAAPAGVTFAKIYAGENHTCGLTPTGQAYCWGRDDYGQLGDGNRTPFNTGNATPVAVGGGLIFRSLSVGELYTCGVAQMLGTPTGPSSAAGTIFCWGDNSFGQLGIGSAQNNAPILVPTKVAFQP